MKTWLKDIELILLPKEQHRHQKCKGYEYWTVNGYEFDCEYDTILDCDEYKYGFGRKDPEAKCNRIK